MNRNRTMTAAVFAATVALTLAGCSSSSKSTSATTSAPPTSTAGGSTPAGSTAQGAATGTPITIGLVTSLTGLAAQNFIGAEQSVTARFDQQNAEGGIDGHPLKLVTVDDASSVQGADTAAQELIQEKHVFSLIFISDLVSTAYKAAQQAGVPVVGAPIDGPEWGSLPNTNMVSVGGDQPPIPPASTQQAVVAKMAGATNMAALAIANEEPSIYAEQDFMAGAKALGLKVGYYNDSTPIGGVNVTPLVLAMKSAGVDGFQSAMLDTTNFAIMTAARQEGLKLVAPMQDVGYDQALLNDPSAVQSAQGAIISVLQVPVEEKTAATQAEQAAFEQYEHFSGVPNLNWSYGWLAADLTIHGLESAGANATRTSFLDSLRNVKGWDGEGLLPVASDFSLADFGKLPSQTTCSYYVKVSGNAFVPLNNGKPICGTYLNP
jgi:ABC-type branched-subunit amino acid transport system substrate-binding protein